MRTDSRQYGFLYWVKRAFLGVLGAYLLLSSCPWSVFHPVSFLYTLMVHSMQALGLASGPAAVDVNGPPATSPDHLACAGYDGAHPRVRPCFSGPALPSYMTTAFHTCPSGALGSHTHTCHADGPDSVPSCVPSDASIAATTRAASLLFFVIALALSLICTAPLCVARHHRARRWPPNTSTSASLTIPDGHYHPMPFGADCFALCPALFRSCFRLIRSYPSRAWFHFSLSSSAIGDDGAPPSRSVEDGGTHVMYTRPTSLRRRVPTLAGGGHTTAIACCLPYIVNFNCNLACCLVTDLRRLFRLLGSQRAAYIVSLLSQIPCVVAVDGDGVRRPMFDGVSRNYRTWCIALGAYISLKYPDIAPVFDLTAGPPDVNAGASQEDLDAWNRLNRQLYGIIQLCLPEWLMATLSLSARNEGQAALHYLHQEYGPTTALDRTVAMADIHKMHLDPRAAMDVNHIRFQYDQMRRAQADLVSAGGTAVPDATLITLFDAAIAQCTAYDTIRMFVSRARHQTFAAHYQDYVSQVRAENRMTNIAHSTDAVAFAALPPPAATGGRARGAPPPPPPLFDANLRGRGRGGGGRGRGYPAGQLTIMPPGKGKGKGRNAPRNATRPSNAIVICFRCAALGHDRFNCQRATVVCTICRGDHDSSFHSRTDLTDGQKKVLRRDATVAASRGNPPSRSTPRFAAATPEIVMLDAHEQQPAPATAEGFVSPPEEDLIAFAPALPCYHGSLDISFAYWQTSLPVVPVVSALDARRFLYAQAALAPGPTTGLRLRGGADNDDMSDAIVLGLRQSLESLQADEASHMDHALEESRLLTMGVAASVAAEATTHSLYIESAMTETERIEWAISASMSDAEVMSTPSGPDSASASAASGAVPWPTTMADLQPLPANDAWAPTAPGPLPVGVRGRGGRGGRGTRGRGHGRGGRGAPPPPPVVAPASSTVQQQELHQHDLHLARLQHALQQVALDVAGRLPLLLALTMLTLPRRWRLTTDWPLFGAASRRSIRPTTMMMTMGSALRPL